MGRTSEAGAEMRVKVLAFESATRNDHFLTVVAEDGLMWEWVELREQREQFKRDEIVWCRTQVRRFWGKP